MRIVERQSSSDADDSNPRNAVPFLWPALISALVLLVSGWGYREVAEHYDRQVGSMPFVRGTLSGFPLRVDNWYGHEAPFAPEVVETSSTDDHISRVYVRDITGDAVSLYIGVGVRYRDLAPHRAEVCYVVSGWTLQSSSHRDIHLNDTDVLPCQVHEFTRGGLSSEKLTVLSYYILDGQFSRDVGALRRIAWQGNTDVRYVAQVQIAASGLRSTETAGEILGEFARVSSAPILNVLRQSVESLGLAKSGNPVDAS